MDRSGVPPCQEAALKSFFHVPRVLRSGEVLAIPLHGLSEALRAVEVPRDPAESRVVPDLDATTEAEVFEVAPHLGTQEVAQADPLHGFAFCDFFSFKVEVLERPCESHSFQIDKAAEIRLKGSSQARGIPYISSHQFCEAPPALLPSLRPAMERLLGMLAPAVRAWELRTVPDLPSILTIGPRGCGKRILWRSVCERLGLHLLEVNCSQLADGGTEARATCTFRPFCIFCWVEESHGEWTHMEGDSLTTLMRVPCPELNSCGSFGFCVPRRHEFKSFALKPPSSRPVFYASGGFKPWPRLGHLLPLLPLCCSNVGWKKPWLVPSGRPGRRSGC